MDHRHHLRSRLRAIVIHFDNLAEIAQVKRDGRLIANPIDSRLDARRAQCQILKTRDDFCLKCIACKFRAVTAEHKTLLLSSHAFAFAAPAVMF